MAGQASLAQQTVPAVKHHSTRLQINHIKPFLSHVDSEEAALRAFCKVINDMPSQMVNRKEERLFRQRLEQSMAVSEQMSERRGSILLLMGRICGLQPHEVSISELIARSEPSVKEILIACQRRLQRVIAQLQHLSSVVSWIMNESRLINSILLQEVVGDKSSDRYTSSGMRSIAPESVHFQTRS